MEMARDRMIRRGLPDREVVPFRECVSLVRRERRSLRERWGKNARMPRDRRSGSYVVEHLSQLPARARHDGARELAGAVRELVEVQVGLDRLELQEDGRAFGVTQHVDPRI